MARASSFELALQISAQIAPIDEGDLMPLDQEIAQVLQALEGALPIDSLPVDALHASITYPPIDSRILVGSAEDSPRSGIDRLKAGFRKTRELYPEVCALLFFRFGITPAANRLYQLVKRGSMGTRTQVLAEFWTEPREKSRVRIQHPDLRADLQDVGANPVATL